MSEETEYPECEKMQKAQPVSQEIGEFLEWCGNRGWFLAQYDGGEAYQLPYSTESLLAKYFRIDLDRVEEEKREMMARYPNG